MHICGDKRLADRLGQPRTGLPSSGKAFWLRSWLGARGCTHSLFTYSCAYALRHTIALSHIPPLPLTIGSSGKPTAVSPHRRPCGGGLWGSEPARKRRTTRPRHPRRPIARRVWATMRCTEPCACGAGWSRVCLGSLSPASSPASSPAIPRGGSLSKCWSQTAQTAKPSGLASWRMRAILQRGTWTPRGRRPPDAHSRWPRTAHTTPSVTLNAHKFSKARRARRALVKAD